MRKAIVIVTYAFAYLTWVPVALIPLFIDVPHQGRGDFVVWDS